MVLLKRIGLISKFLSLFQINLFLWINLFLGIKIKPIFSSFRVSWILVSFQWLYYFFNLLRTCLITKVCVLPFSYSYVLLRILFLENNICQAKKVQERTINKNAKYFFRLFKEIYTLLIKQKRIELSRLMLRMSKMFLSLDFWLKEQHHLCFRNVQIYFFKISF